SLVLDGTALVEEAGAGATSTTSVLYVDAAGTGVSVWRFHSENPGEVMTQKGKLSETGMVLEPGGNLPELRIERKNETLFVARSLGALESSTAFRRRKAQAASPADGT